MIDKRKMIAGGFRLLVGGGSLVQLVNWCARHPGRASLNIRLHYAPTEGLPIAQWVVTVTLDGKEQAWEGSELEPLIAQAVIATVRG
jgi:hypothetical protein